VLHGESFSLKVARFRYDLAIHSTPRLRSLDVVTLRARSGFYLLNGRVPQYEMDVMNLFDLIKEGLRTAWTLKSLWLFGFFILLGSGGGNNGAGGNGGAEVPGPAGAAPPAEIVPLILIVVIVIAAAVVMHFLSEGAVIEGVARSRREGRSLSVREGFRKGWAHWGVLFRIAIIYFAASLASALLLAAPYLIAVRLTGGSPALIVLGIPTVLVAVPWLVTLYIWRAFAARIAVLENRRGIDALRKARLFLHGRLLHGLKLVVATLLGSLAVVSVGLLVLAPIGLLLAGLAASGGVFPAFMLGALILLPAVFVLAAITGTFQSSIWTIGYLSEQGHRS
jgi:hypothetical protein